MQLTHKSMTPIWTTIITTGGDGGKDKATLIPSLIFQSNKNKCRVSMKGKNQSWNR
jgi:hypothetical protein